MSGRVKQRGKAVRVEQGEGQRVGTGASEKGEKKESSGMPLLGTHRNRHADKIRSSCDRPEAVDDPFGPGAPGLGYPAGLVARLKSALGLVGVSA